LLDEDNAFDLLLNSFLDNGGNAVDFRVNHVQPLAHILIFLFLPLLSALLALGVVVAVLVSNSGTNHATLVRPC
jgi:Na+/proline symporter